MQSSILNAVIIGVALVVIIASQALYTVDETEQAILLQFGQPIGAEGEIVKGPGLHAKIPFIQQVRTFDARILSVDPATDRVNISSEGVLRQVIAEEDSEELTVEERAQAEAALGAEVSGEPILVDTFARFRITDPLAFLKTLQNEQNAVNRISTVMNNVTRHDLGAATHNQLLSQERTAIMADIRTRVNRAMVDGGFGVEIVDLRIVRADLTEKLRASTVNRMITERRERATETRAEGREKALEIRSTAEKERTVILAEAQRDSQIIRGEGDRQAIKTYADAFNKDPDFYEFLRSMEAYTNTLSDENTQLILSPDSEFLKFIRER